MLMPGMPSRATPSTYPAPPSEPFGISACSRNPFQPVPWTKFIFSSSVICWITRSARWSGVSDVFIHGQLCVALGGGAGDCAQPTSAKPKQPAPAKESKRVTERVTEKDGIVRPLDRTSPCYEPPNPGVNPNPLRKRLSLKLF